MTRKQTGLRGEQAVALYLRNRGYTIIEKNFRCREGEIDIVASKDGCLVFVEVRSKRSTMFGTAAESVNAAKQEHLRAAAARYLQSHPGLPEQWRIDVACVEFGRGDAVRQIEIIEHAIEDE